MFFEKDECPVISKGDFIQWEKSDHSIFNESLNEDYLYHYTTIQSLVAIAKSKTLRASSFEHVNDPTESNKSNRHSLCGKFNDKKDKSLNEKLTKAMFLGQKVADDVRRKAHVFCFCEDGFETCGIIRKGYAIPQMWSHYASSQKGVCLIFSKKEILSEAKKAFSNCFGRPVVYDTAQASGATIKINPEKVMALGEDEYRTRCLEYSPDLFWFYKDDGWKYEQEYRLVIPESTENHSYLSIEKAVVGICLGAKFPLQSQPHINKFKEVFHIKDEKTPRIKWDKGIGYPAGIGTYF